MCDHQDKQNGEYQTANIVRLLPILGYLDAPDADGLLLPIILEDILGVEVEQARQGIQKELGPSKQNEITHGIGIVANSLFPELGKDSLTAHEHQKTEDEPQLS